MPAYLPFIVWIVSAYICYTIAKARRVKSTHGRRIVVLLLGPLAIPLVFFLKTEPSPGHQ